MFLHWRYRVHVHCVLRSAVLRSIKRRLSHAFKHWHHVCGTLRRVEVVELVQQSALGWRRQRCLSRYFAEWLRASCEIVRAITLRGKLNRKFMLATFEQWCYVSLHAIDTADAGHRAQHWYHHVVLRTSLCTWRSWGGVRREERMYLEKVVRKSSNFYRRSLLQSMWRPWRDRSLTAIASSSAIVVMQ